MEQASILRKFIQGLETMRTGDQQGEDNFGTDFMVSTRGICPLTRTPASTHAPRFLAHSCNISPRQASLHGRSVAHRAMLKLQRCDARSCPG